MCYFPEASVNFILLVSFPSHIPRSVRFNMKFIIHVRVAQFRWNRGGVGDRWKYLQWQGLILFSVEGFRSQSCLWTPSCPHCSLRGELDLCFPGASLLHKRLPQTAPPAFLIWVCNEGDKNFVSRQLEHLFTQADERWRNVRDLLETITIGSDLKLTLWKVGPLTTVSFQYLT